MKITSKLKIKAFSVIALLALLLFGQISVFSMNNVQNDYKSNMTELCYYPDWWESS